MNSEDMKEALRLGVDSPESDSMVLALMEVSDTSATVNLELLRAVQEQLFEVINLVAYLCMTDFAADANDEYIRGSICMAAAERIDKSIELPMDVLNFALSEEWEREIYRRKAADAA